MIDRTLSSSSGEDSSDEKPLTITLKMKHVLIMQNRTYRISRFCTWKFLRLIIGTAVFASLSISSYIIVMLHDPSFGRKLKGFMPEDKLMAKRGSLFFDIPVNPVKVLKREQNITVHDTPENLRTVRGVHDEEMAISEAGVQKIVMPPFTNSTDQNGLGEMGKKVKIQDKDLTEEEKERRRKGWETQWFDELVSEKISIQRSLPDCYNNACRQLVNGSTVHLQISVVIIFYNEAWTTLLRSVHSVLDRTPSHVLGEVVLVDDMSTNDNLKAALDEYFSPFPKVNIVRSPVRGGLTKARLLGVQITTFPVLVFLDSHIECFPGWIEPLLIRIQEKPTAVVYPVLEYINDVTFAVVCAKRAPFIGKLNIRTFRFQYKILTKSRLALRKSEAEPIR